MDDTFRFVWGEYRAWAVTSRVLKVRITRISLVVLCLTIVGTAIVTLSPLFAVPNASAKLQAAAGVLKFLPCAAAVALGIAAYLTNQLITDSQSQAWAKARALAEGLKSESYKYVTAAPTYDVP